MATPINQTDNIDKPQDTTEPQKTSVPEVTETKPAEVEKVEQAVQDQMPLRPENEETAQGDE